MKRGFGIFFIVLGILNLIVGLIGVTTEYKAQAFPKITFGIVVLSIGAIMYSSSKPKEVEEDYEYKSYKLKKIQKKNKKAKKKKSEFPLKKE